MLTPFAKEQLYSLGALSIRVDAVLDVVSLSANNAYLGSVDLFYTRRVKCGKRKELVRRRIAQRLANRQTSTRAPLDQYTRHPIIISLLQRR